jgi:hypothetical protein
MKLATWMLVAGSLTACNKKGGDVPATGSGSSTGVTVTTTVTKVGEPDPKLVKTATDTVAAATNVDAALKYVATRVGDGKAPGSWWTGGLRGPSKSKNATPEQKQAAIDIAKAYADNTKYGGYQRGEAVELLAEIDPPTGKTYADKYADDKDLKDAAARAHKKLEKKP